MSLSRDDLERAYVRIAQPIYNIAYRMLWDAEDSRDIVQETFLRLWRRRASVPAEALDNWCYKTAANLCRSKLRARGLRNPQWLLKVKTWMQFSAPAGLSVESSLLTAEIKTALQSLSPKLREALLLHVYSGLDYTEIAAALSISAGTVGSRIHRAIRQLRKFYNDEVN